MSDCFELIDLRRPVASKEHICQWCREAIVVGEKHVYYVGIFDGFQHTRMHEECYDAMTQSDLVDDLLPLERVPRGEIYVCE